MTEAEQPILGVMAADAEAIAALLRAKRGDKAIRRRARVALAQAFAMIDLGAQGTASPDACAAPEDDGRAGVADALPAARELEAVRRNLGDGAQPAVRPLREVWVRSPYPVRVMPLIYDLQRQRLVASLAARCELPMALSEARITWMETRCNIEQPGVVRQVRPADSPGAERLLGSELELIRKRGRSRFS